MKSLIKVYAFNELTKKIQKLESIILGLVSMESYDIYKLASTFLSIHSEYDNIKLLDSCKSNLEYIEHNDLLDSYQDLNNFFTELLSFINNAVPDFADQGVMALLSLSSTEQTELAQSVKDAFVPKVSDFKVVGNKFLKSYYILGKEIYKDEIDTYLEDNFDNEAVSSAILNAYTSSSDKSLQSTTTTDSFTQVFGNNDKDKVVRAITSYIAKSRDINTTSSDSETKSLQTIILFKNNSKIVIAKSPRTKTYFNRQKEVQEKIKVTASETSTEDSKNLIALKTVTDSVKKSAEKGNFEEAEKVVETVETMGGIETIAENIDENETKPSKLADNLLSTETTTKNSDIYRKLEQTGLSSDYISVIMQNISKSDDVTNEQISKVIDNLLPMFNINDEVLKTELRTLFIENKETLTSNKQQIKTAIEESKNKAPYLVSDIPNQKNTSNTDFARFADYFKDDDKTDKLFYSSNCDISLNAEHGYMVFSVYSKESEKSMKCKITATDSSGAKVESNEFEIEFSYIAPIVAPTYGVDGEDGLNSLVAKRELDLEADETECSNGGFRVEVGLDNDKNGILNTDEVLETFDICNGTNGTDGTNGEDGVDGTDGENGLNSIINQTNLSVGDTNCPNGGTKFDSGLDLNSNSILDSDEINQTSYICNGINGQDGIDGTNGTTTGSGADGQDGLNSIVNQTNLSVGDSNCANGGTKFNSGLDSNSNSILDSNEINLTSYICNGTNGSNGTDGNNGIDGTNGEDGIDGADGLNSIITTSTFESNSTYVNGGILIQSGLDSNSNGVLDSDEITSSQIIENLIDSSDTTAPTVSTVEFNETKIQITFSEKINKNTISQSSIIVIDPKYNQKFLDFTTDDNLTFTSSDLALEGNYTIWLTTQIEDLKSNKLSENYTTQLELKSLNISVTQFGGTNDDDVMAIRTDANQNIYLLGHTESSLDGSNGGSNDIFLAKYDSQNNQIWIDQFGGTGNDFATKMTFDSSNNIYAIGSTFSDLNGSNSGNSDAWISKYDLNGNQIWLKQFGGTGYEYLYDIQIDSSDNLYLVGHSGSDLVGTFVNGYDLIVAKYDTNGDRIWLKQFGTSGHDKSRAIVLDEPNENIYFAGLTASDLNGTNAGSNDAFVAKYDFNGNQIWLNQFGGSGHDEVKTITIDNNQNIYLAGMTSSDLNGTNAGSYDAFIAKYDSNNNQIWLNQFGGTEDDRIYSIAIQNNELYLNGYSEISSNNEDLLFAKYDLNGNKLWQKTYGETENDSISSAYFDKNQTLYFAGTTESNLSNINAGGSDAIFGKYDISGTVLPTLEITNTAISSSELNITFNYKIESNSINSATVYILDENSSMIFGNFSTQDDLTFSFSPFNGTFNNGDYKLIITPEIEESENNLELSESFIKNLTL